MKFIKKSILICYSVLLASLSLLMSQAIAASPEISIAGQAACNSAVQSCVPISPPTRECDIRACMSAADRAIYEKTHDCVFLPNGCQGMDTQSQCCSKDEATGKSKAVDKQATKEDPKFDWAAYQKQCPNMKQSNGKPDGLWPQCVVGKPHTSTDAWPVTEVLSNGSARSYCIDGCSTPQWVIDALLKSRTFLVNDKDNPIGHTNSSFYNACKQHDICYQSCTNTSQASCDQRLLADSVAQCNTIPFNHTTLVKYPLGIETNENTREACINAAEKMNIGLRPRGSNEVGGGGGDAFKTRRQQMCQCC